ncbi:MAG: gliding motility lipoprotein GldD [Pseudarcicella sp.]|nr:gliding motility lipoprotein GldD [Pseudarcicella sp.]MBP6410336.1 gliding motility lipoprotein GldD [Pseudarcicella sp.]
MRLLIVFFSILTILATGCRNKNKNAVFQPKPKGYNRIDLPTHEYRLLEEDHPYTFEVSKYAVVKKDSVSWAEPHWIYVYYPQFEAMIQFTYKPLNNDKKKLSKLIDDAYKLAAKHNIKAYSIQEKMIEMPNNLKANLIKLEGEVPSYLQFYTTDSTKHYLRGAVYFNTALKSDSLKPVIDYLNKDVIHLLNTLKWK